MHEKGVDERSQSLDGGIVLMHDRLLGEVSRCHHNRRHLLAEQMVQRRIGQHDAKKIVVGRHLRRHLRPHSPLPHEHDRPLAALQQPPLLFVDLGDRPCRRHIPHHHRHGLVDTLLAAPQEADRPIVRRIAGKMKSTHALDGDDFPGPQEILDGPDRRITAGHRRVLVRGLPREPDRRPASGAGIGLRMKAAVSRIGIFRAALRAHREAAHRRLRAVIR